MLAWARAEGRPLKGTVDERSVAFGPIDDELRISGADEVITSTLPPSRSNCIEIVERLREELDIPITHKVRRPRGRRRDRRTTGRPDAGPHRS
jgi:hypothetical protein